LPSLSRITLIVRIDHKTTHHSLVKESRRWEEAVTRQYRFKYDRGMSYLPQNPISVPQLVPSITICLEHTYTHPHLSCAHAGLIVT